mmetsp:Transcript_127098/g.219259  ORF Transcript_127098/g.219259 Transcript_127098/m.219259 type:complete len:266 (-) Transcript_127098:44-841(-)
MGAANYGFVTGTNCVITTDIPSSGFVSGRSYVVTVTSARGLARKIGSDQPGFAGQNVVDHHSKVTKSSHGWTGTTDSSATFRALCGKFDEMWVADPVTVRQDTTTTTITAKATTTTMTTTTTVSRTATATRAGTKARTMTTTQNDEATTTTATSEFMTTSSNTTSTPSNCPAQEPEVGLSCTPFQGSCPYGEECCCGECGPSFVVGCLDGTWQGYHTDRCLGPCTDLDIGLTSLAWSQKRMTLAAGAIVMVMLMRTAAGQLQQPL